MTERSGSDWSLTEFIGTRQAWLHKRAMELGLLFRDLHHELHGLLPDDLGDRRTTAALALARIAADEARVEPESTTVGWLKGLIPHGYRHDLDRFVRETRGALADAEDPALWAWNVEAWEELLLAVWRHERAAATDEVRADDELVERWGLTKSQISRLRHPWRGFLDNGSRIESLHAYLADDETTLRILGQAVLREEDIEDASADTVADCEQTLGGAGHLAFLARQILAAEGLQDWCAGESQDASASTQGFLRSLSNIAEAYVDDVMEPWIDALSACELAVLNSVRDEHVREVDAYLSEFIGCTDNMRASVSSDLDRDVSDEVARRHDAGELTWHGIRGSVPVWYHIVTSPAERAAALAFSGRTDGVIDILTTFWFPVHGDATGTDTVLRNGRAESQDWYPEPGIELIYSEDKARDLCAFLALLRVGHARLDFLTEVSDGKYAVLRSLKVEIPEGFDQGTQEALRLLRRLVPVVSDLPHVLAGESDTGMGWGEDFDNWPDDGDEKDFDDDNGNDSGDWEDVPATADNAKGGADARTTPEPPGSERGRQPSPPRSRGELPPELLRKVKSLLRKAEDSAVGELEAQAYLEKAAQLMAKYGIEQALLDGDEPTSEQPVNRVINVYAPWLRECRRLLGAIALELRCRTLIYNDVANQHRVHAFGFAADLQAVEILYASLRLQMLTGADIASDTRRPPNEGVRRYKRSWMIGFIGAVAKRIRAAQESASEESETERTSTDSSLTSRSVALVLAGRTAAVDAAIAAQFPKLGKSRKMTFGGSGYWQGYADGQRADIGGPRLSDDGDPELTT